MKKVSPLSATQIGAVENVGNRALIRNQFKEEAKAVSSELEKIHHCRKIAHMQVYYPNTITTLSQAKPEVPMVQQKPMTQTQVARAMRESEYYATANAKIQDEHYMNHRKRAYNREIGRKAVLDGILKGTAPVGPNILYPEKATHNQCLHLSGSICMPNPNVIPPAVPARKKWMGDDVGWA